MQLHEMNGQLMQSLNVVLQSQTSNEYFRLTNVIVFQSFRTEYDNLSLCHAENFDFGVASFPFNRRNAYVCSKPNAPIHHAPERYHTTHGSGSFAFAHTSVRSLPGNARALPQRQPQRLPQRRPSLAAAPPRQPAAGAEQREISNNTPVVTTTSAAVTASLRRPQHLDTSSLAV